MTHLRPALLLLLDRLHDTPAMVVSDLGDRLALNPMAAALFGAEEGGNINRIWFTDPAARELFPPEERADISRAHVAHLRALHAARPKDRQVTELVGELLATSPEFADLWERHDVSVRRHGRKILLHPLVGRLDLDCEILAAADRDQLLLVYTARPGTDTAERLELLRVIGRQDLTAREGLGAEAG